MNNDSKKLMALDVLDVLAQSKLRQLNVCGKHYGMAPVSDVLSSLRGNWIRAQYLLTSKRRWSIAGGRGDFESQLEELGFKVQRAQNDRGNWGRFVSIDLSPRASVVHELLTA